MAFCTNCGHQSADGEKFCAACGTATDSILLPVPSANTQSIQHYSYVAQPIVIAPAIPSESGMGAAIKGLFLWFVLTVIFVAATFRESSETRMGVTLITCLIAIAYIIGKVRAGRRRGAVVSNVWAAYGAIIFLILMVVASLANIGSKETRSSATQPAGNSSIAKLPPTAAPVISADSLFNAYDQNEVAADQEYKGQKMQITGRVGSIGKDFADNAYIILPSSTNMFEGVHAGIADSETSKTASLRKGQHISLTCEITGKILTDVVAKNCVIND